MRPLTDTNAPNQQIEVLTERLATLGEARVRINESLELDGVLQLVVDSACALTGARYGVIKLLDDGGEVARILAHGMTEAQIEELRELQDGHPFIEYFGGLDGVLRVNDFQSHCREQGLPEVRSPWQGDGELSLLATPIRHDGTSIGIICLSEQVEAREFSLADEETLTTFAAQAALVIVNSRRYRDEQRARADLETLIETSPVGVIAFDAATGIPLWVNREARNIASSLHDPDEPPEHLLGLMKIRRGDGTEVSLQDISLVEVLGRGETVRAEEVVFSRDDGRSVAVMVNATPIFSESGAVETVVVAAQDMKPIVELERLRAEFLAMVSHELRAPLTSIKGSAATLLDLLANPDPAETAQLVRIIDMQANRMRDLISDLLDVARIETGSLPVVPEPTDLARLVDDARNTFLSGGGREHIVIDLDPDLPLVLADKRRILQVLNNLLQNASAYSDESSPIHVSATQQDIHVAVSVSDRGRGVSAERLPFLFQKFWRFDPEEGGREIPGSGLGLAISKGIVESHGGRVWAESDGPGLGTRFTFTLPAVAGTRASAAIEPDRNREDTRRTEHARARILAVDDDPQTLRHVRETLVQAGYSVTVTGDPGDALNLTLTGRPDLVILDLVLPGTDGIELMQTLRAHADVPVIFLSGYGRDDVISTALEAGAADYVVKPFSPTELVARIRAALRMREASDQALPSGRFTLGDLVINYAEREVAVAGQPLRLTPTEYNLLTELSANAGRVLTHDQLLRRVWRSPHVGSSGTVRTTVKRLRRKLGDDVKNPRYVITVPGVGYRIGKPGGG